MARGRQRGVVAGLAAAILISLAAVSQCLAPSLTYEIKAGSYYRLGVLLNRYLKEKAGYELELVATAGVPENIGALLDPARDIHLAMTESSADEGVIASELAGLAALGRQYFFVIVPSSDAGRKGPGILRARYHDRPAHQVPAIQALRSLHGMCRRALQY